MGAVRVPDPFTHYIFVDNDARCTYALDLRIAAAGTAADVKLINGEANDAAGEIRRALPPFSRDRGLLCFCFVDPYAANLKFQTIRELAALRMDFLILLMLGRDVRTNLQRYLDDESDLRVGELIDFPAWRKEFRSGHESIVPYLLRKFDEAMTDLGYFPCVDDQVHQQKIAGKNVFLYSLVFYSSSKLDQKFWRETLRRTDPQMGLDFDA